jgi:predicted transcriptional regulator
MSRSPQQKKKAITIRLPPDLYARLRSFLREQAAAPFYIKPASLGESAIRRELDRLEAALAAGQPSGLPTDEREADPQPVKIAQRHIDNHRITPRR